MFTESDVVPRKALQHRLLVGACLGVWLGILAFGLWPFNFHPRNRVEWLPNQNGIHFGGYAEAYSRSPWIRNVPADPDQRFTVELWMRSVEKNYHSVSGLVSLVDSSPEPFTIAQSGPDVLVRGQFQDANRHVAIRRLYIDDVFQQTQAHLIAMTSGSEGTQLYLDGVPQRRFPVTLTANNFTGRLLLGHNFAGHQHWSGDLLGLAIYDQALTRAQISEDYSAWQQAKATSLTKRTGLAALYLFDERVGDVIHSKAGDAPNIIIPEWFSILHKTILGIPRDLHRANLDLKDIAINIAGFVPFGFFLCAYLRCEKHAGAGRAILLTILLGALTSLTIELLQAYLPSRDSSLLDVIDNTLGTFFGAVLQSEVASVVSRARRPVV